MESSISQKILRIDIYDAYQDFDHFYLSSQSSNHQRSYSILVFTIETQRANGILKKEKKKIYSIVPNYVVFNTKPSLVHENLDFLHKILLKKKWQIKESFHKLLDVYSIVLFDCGEEFLRYLINHLFLLCFQLMFCILLDILIFGRLNPWVASILLIWAIPGRCPNTTFVFHHFLLYLRKLKRIFSFLKVLNRVLFIWIFKRVHLFEFFLQHGQRELDYRHSLHL